MSRVDRQQVTEMKWGRQGVRQLTALLVLAIVTAASGLPHWHTAPVESPDKGDTLLSRLSTGTEFLVSAPDADLLECAACVLQRILTHARTQGTEPPPQPSPQAEIEPTSERLVSPPALGFSDPRGPPSS